MKLILAKIFLSIALVLASLFFMAKDVLAASTGNAIDNRSIKLAKFFQSHDSELANYASDYVSQADKNGLDYRLLPAISGVESTFGRNYIYGSYNAYGWGGGLIYFKSWPDSISQITKGLKDNYVDKGAKDVEAISWIYCPPGNLTWAAKVRYFMDQIDQTEAALPKENPSLSLALTI